MAELLEVNAETPPDTQSLFCNPVFEADEAAAGCKTQSKDKETSDSSSSRTRLAVMFVCPLSPGSVIVLCVTVLLLMVTLGLVLLLLCTHVMSVEERNVTHVTPTVSILTHTSSAALYSASCGGVLAGSVGIFSSPNHPDPYPPLSLCVWEIRVPAPAVVQLRVFALGVEGPSPCLFDWLELQEEAEEIIHNTRFCGNVAPPTINTNSSRVWVTFRSDDNIESIGFTAQYRAVLPQHRSCSHDEFVCDGGRCIVLMSLCDYKQDCVDNTDETNCSHTARECGGQKTGTGGFVSSPNHPHPYPHSQNCVWHISVPARHTVQLTFHNFSVEPEEQCLFDYVEVWDGDRMVGRFCGSDVPPVLNSSRSDVTLTFVTDDAGTDVGFFASYQAVPLLNRTCSPAHFRCGSGECVRQQLVCDGWSDCMDGGDEQECYNVSNTPLSSSCEPVQVEMCQGLIYNMTSFPNIWLSLTDQREAAASLLHYQAFSDVPCSEPLRRLACALLVPQCVPHAGVLQPCRSVCISVQQQCSHTLHLLTLIWPFRCHLLPDLHDPRLCTLL